MEKQSYAVPVAIVIAGLLIAGAVYFGGSGQSLFGGPTEDVAGSNLENLVPVSSSDHVTGNSDGAIALIEYSDLECPFCKVFHEAMNAVLAERTDIKWVYRHYPIDSLHAQARAEAEAAACVGKLGGSEKFWAYIDSIFDTTKSNDGLDLAQLPVLAEKVGVTKTDLDACITSGDGKKIVDADYESGTAIDVSGTPFPILIDSDGRAHAIFEQNFDPTKAELSAEAVELVNDLYAEYERIVRGQ